MDDTTITFTRSQLTRMSKSDLMDLYRLHINDEMFWMMWRGNTKLECVNAILGGADVDEISWV